MIGKGLAYTYFQKLSPPNYLSKAAHPICFISSFISFLPEAIEVLLSREGGNPSPGSKGGSPSPVSKGGMGKKRGGGIERFDINGGGNREILVLRNGAGGKGGRIKAF